MIPSPLYKDPIYDGAADPMVIRKEADGKYYMFYTQRRANQQVDGVSYCYGSMIGVAESVNGRDWHYRGVSYIIRHLLKGNHHLLRPL